MLAGISSDLIGCPRIKIPCPAIPWPDAKRLGTHLDRRIYFIRELREIDLDAIDRRRSEQRVAEMKDLGLSSIGCGSVSLGVAEKSHDIRRTA